MFHFCAQLFCFIDADLKILVEEKMQEKITPILRFSLRKNSIRYVQKMCSDFRWCNFLFGIAYAAFNNKKNGYSFFVVFWPLFANSPHNYLFLDTRRA
ncbi:hypothetical protein COV82_05355 [Candidatus Peregrinibacteria bacterium CG11_big_fil_rev_8_21_14_0_20_46_8]|nr:MAG: hypothetical protein COV82_05355 [Candidatus Peregrinibacteria bacterium CG11_big_fil_rev_8_21_14_0_20_46_8]